MLTDLDSRDPLNWLSRILWPNGSTKIEPGGSSPQWWASPSIESPKILIPAGSLAAAKTAVGRYHDGFSPKLRLRSITAELMMSADPVAEAMLRNKLVGVLGLGSVDEGVLAGIQELLGVPELHVAVSLSTPKSNQKPVLQLLAGDGTCLGWAKVAWNDRTEALVGTEAYWLQREPSAPLSMPRLLHDVEIAGRRVAISSGVQASRRPRRSPDALPPLEVFHAVSALGTVCRGPIRESLWWQSVERLLGDATDRERAAILTAADACGDRQIQVGAWHGDLTPWNLMTAKDRVHLIDWEFGADGAPLGFDLCHFHTQVASEMKNLSPGSDPATAAAAALDYSARLSPQGLAALGVEPRNRSAIWRLYLVELVRRYVALRVNGYPTDQVVQGPAALDRLERSLTSPQCGSTAEPRNDPAQQTEQPVQQTEQPVDQPLEQRSDFARLLGTEADFDAGYSIVEQQTGVHAR